MDIGRRSAELANVVCAVLLVTDFGDKHGWWNMSYLTGFVGYALPFSILVALAVNVWALHRRREVYLPAEAKKDSAALRPTWRTKDQVRAEEERLRVVVESRDAEIARLKELVTNADKTAAQWKFERDREASEVKLQKEYLADCRAELSRRVEGWKKASPILSWTSRVRTLQSRLGEMKAIAKINPELRSMLETPLSPIEWETSGNYNYKYAKLRFADDLKELMSSKPESLEPTLLPYYPEATLQEVADALENTVKNAEASTKALIGA